MDRTRILDPKSIALPPLSLPGAYSLGGCQHTLTHGTYTGQIHHHHYRQPHPKSMGLQQNVKAGSRQERDKVRTEALPLLPLTFARGPVMTNLPEYLHFSAHRSKQQSDRVNHPQLYHRSHWQPCFIPPRGVLSSPSPLRICVCGGARWEGALRWCSERVREQSVENPGPDAVASRKTLR